MPTGSLVDAPGEATTSAVSVSLTYGHLGDLGESLLGRLTSIDDEGNLVPLKSYGMADIEVARGGERLHVAPGAEVGITFTATQLQRQTLSGLDNSTLPGLFFLDPSLGQWRPFAQVGDGNVTYDRQSGAFAAWVPHLIGWNMDEGIPANSGGCVTGLVTDGCTGKPLPGQSVTFWLLDYDESGRFFTTSNGDGQWCATTGSPDRPSLDPTTYMVSGATMAVTNSCNPLPAHCRSCPDVNLHCPNSAQRNCCRNQPNTADNQAYLTDTPQDEPTSDASKWWSFHGYDTCDQKVTIAPCCFCAGNLPNNGKCAIAQAAGHGARRVAPPALALKRTVSLQFRARLSNSSAGGALPHWRKTDIRRGVQIAAGDDESRRVGRPGEIFHSLVQV